MHGLTDNDKTYNSQTIHACAIFVCVWYIGIADVNMCVRVHACSLAAAGLFHESEQQQLARFCSHVNLTWTRLNFGLLSFQRAVTFGLEIGLENDDYTLATALPF